MKQPKNIARYVSKAGVRASDDVLAEIAAEEDEARGFCPTGVGGGVDNSCGTKDGARLSPGAGLLSPTGAHDVQLPKNPKRLTVALASEAMKKVGYTLGKGAFSSKDKATTFAITDGNGKTTSITTDKMKEIVYGTHADPAVAATKISKARRR